ncbi:MAG: hypothetical protein CFE30_25880 [Bradyrhizobium sp. PARBB1]|nr:MAG: hypothetical protein CFE30_25880 [Bradyrhizobium sp. PARBB1]
MLEFHTYCWMMGLSPKLEIYSGASELSWADRVDWIRRTIKGTKITPSLRAEVTAELNAITKMYELRNIVAHGPMIWGKHDDGTLFAVVPNVKKSMKGKPSKIVEFSDIESAIPTSEAIYRRMKDLLDRVGVELGIKIPPYPDTTSASRNPKN